MKNEIVVLIPHYNDVEGLKKSLYSISSNENVDVLVIDDGSNFANLISEEDLRFFFNAKGTLQIKYLNSNMGITNALNIGLEYIMKTDYKYVARLDSGDRCLGERFRIQASFLESNLDVALVGSNVMMTDIFGKEVYKLDVPHNSSKIIRKLFISSSTVIHPSIMFRTKIIEKTGNYPVKYDAAEDYAFYFNVLKCFKISNINSYLLEKEINPESISFTKRKIQARSRIRIIIKNFHFGFSPIYGLLRNSILYLMPNRLLNKIKKMLL